MKEIDKLILASGSRYRKALLERLGIPFDTANPDIDETPQPGERAQALAARLALAKARAAAGHARGQLIIGSDQTASCNGVLLGKPGNIERAAIQLRTQSGNTVTFHTSLALLDTRDGSHLLHTDTTCVHFRALGDDEIQRYLEREQPWDCAGSFKVESLGISLFESIDSRDPTALQGLPLIALCRMLRQKGVEI